MKKGHWLGAVAVVAGVALTGCGGDGGGTAAGGGNGGGDGTPPPSADYYITASVDGALFEGAVDADGIYKSPWTLDAVAKTADAPPATWSIQNLRFEEGRHLCGNDDHLTIALQDLAGVAADPVNNAWMGMANTAQGECELDVTFVDDEVVEGEFTATLAVEFDDGERHERQATGGTFRIPVPQTQGT